MSPTSLSLQQTDVVLVWYAQIGNEEKGKRQLHRIHKNVKGYDVDAQWEALVLTVEHERQVAQLNKSQAWTDIFKGNDLVRLYCSKRVVTIADILDSDEPSLPLGLCWLASSSD